MGKLHELIAVEPDISGESKRVMDEAISIFSKRERFTGQTRTVKMFDESRQNEETVEHKTMDTTVDAKLNYIHAAIVRALDAFVQKEATNTVACADIIVDNDVLAKDVPAAALLGLESRLKQVRDVYESIPTLTPGVEWEWNDQIGAYSQKHPEERIKTEKSLKWQQIAPPTDKHPAQVEKWNADVPVGKILSEEISGMISPAQKSRLIGRIDTLIRAVKQARQRANCVEVKDVNIGQKLVNYIHADAV